MMAGYLGRVNHHLQKRAGRILLNLRSNLALTVVLCGLLAVAGEGNSAEASPDLQGESAAVSWTIPLAELRFQTAPGEIADSEQPRTIHRLDGPAADIPPVQPPAYRIDRTTGPAAFQLTGRLSKRRTMVWVAFLKKHEIGGYPYCRIRYRARGVARDYAASSIVSLGGKDRDGKEAQAPLLDVAEVINDGQWHEVLLKRPTEISAERLRVRLSTVDSSAQFEIGGISFHVEVPRIEAELTGAGGPKYASRGQFYCLDLSSLCNDTYAAAFERVVNNHGMVVDSGTHLPPGRVSVNGLPFQIAEGERNLVCPPEYENPNTEEVHVLGVKTTRHYHKPYGRDDRVSIPVGKNASEVFVILVSELPGAEGQYAMPRAPCAIDDVEMLAVELCYADRDRDFAFPYSLADGGCLVRRHTAVCVVPADHRKTLRELVVHNRVPGKTFSIAAVTLNTSPELVLPEVSSYDDPVRPAKLSPPGGRGLSIRREGNRVEFANDHCRLVLDVSQGFSIAEIANSRSQTPISLDASSGLEVELGDKILTGRAFNTESVTLEDNRLTVALKSPLAEIPLRLSVRLSADESGQLKMNLSAENLGTTDLAPAVRFPVLRGVQIGSLDDTWICFPQYRNIIDDGPGAYLTGNDSSFPMQFFDIFSKRAGIGLAVITHNRDNLSLDYSMAKDAGGVSAFVQSPGRLYSLPAGGSIDYTEASLGAHAGDWHQALAAYKDWLATWHPLKQPEKRQWFQNVFALRSHVTEKYYSWAIPIYDPQTGSFAVDEFIKADTDYLGLPPQAMHLFGWIDLERCWRGHPAGDYLPEAYTGGREALTGAIGKFQEEHAIPVSLYTISDRCLKESAFGKRMGKKAALRREDGSFCQDEFNWYMCPELAAWRDHYVESLVRTQHETGVKVLYVDVFGFFRNYECYSPDHGHPAPCHTNRGAYALIRQLREALPDDVSIWSEYPLHDVGSQFIDGNIHYYCLDWHERFAKTYDRLDRPRRFAAAPQSAYRYAFPQVKQFVFLCGIKPTSGDCKFPFYNGEGLDDCSWCAYAGANLDRVKEGLAIQTKYADCFASATPIPDVPTRQRGVRANCFPGDGRTSWTLFNSRYTTVCGPVLEIEHLHGARYEDVWNGRPLEPEIIGDRAIISLKLYPQQLGCVVQTRHYGVTPVACTRMSIIDPNRESFLVLATGLTPKNALGNSARFNHRILGLMRPDQPEYVAVSVSH